MRLRSSVVRPFVAGTAGLIALLLVAAAMPRSTALEDDHPRTNPDPTAAIVAGGRRRILESGSGNIFDERTSTRKSNKGNKRANKKKQKKKKIALADDDEVYLVQDISVFEELWTIFTDESKTEPEEMKINQLWTLSKPGSPISITAFWEDAHNKFHSLTFVDDKLTFFSPNNNKIEVEFANVPTVKLRTGVDTREVYKTVQQKSQIEIKRVMLNGQQVTATEFKTEFQVAGETDFCTISFLSQLRVFLLCAYYDFVGASHRELRFKISRIILTEIEEHIGSLEAFVQWTGCFGSPMIISGDLKNKEFVIYPAPQVSISKEVDEQMLN